MELDSEPLAAALERLALNCARAAKDNESARVAAAMAQTADLVRQSRTMRYALAALERGRLLELGELPGVAHPWGKNLGDTELAKSLAAKNDDLQALNGRLANECASLWSALDKVADEYGSLEGKVLKSLSRHPDYPDSHYLNGVFADQGQRIHRALDKRHGTNHTDGRTGGGAAPSDQTGQ